jgi:hypothetical protein
MDDTDDFDLWADGLDLDPFDLEEDWADYASASGKPAPLPNKGNSGRRMQLRVWTGIEKKLKTWGVDPKTIREDQAQVVARRRNGKTVMVQRNNQPDVQAITPGGRRMINIEADNVDNKATVLKELRRSRRNDPTARVAGVLFDPATGQPVSKIVWDRQRRRFVQRAGDLRKSDVLRMED